LLVTSVLAAMVAFHGTAARYVFALAREQVLPTVLARVSGGTQGGAPLAGSLVQSLLAAGVVAGFAVAGADPMTSMFVWLSTIGAVCVLLLLTVSSLAARAFFAAGRGARESVLIRLVFPVLGAVVGVLVLVFMLSSLSSLLGTAPGSASPWLVVAVVVVAVLIGLARGGWLRRARPQVYERLGCGTPNPLTVQDQRLSGLAV
jgi:amino acid transporter